jgi:hypothetical protein
MELQFAVTCDHALIDGNNKLSIIGIFDKIFAKQLPTTHPSFFFVAIIQAHRSEIGNHEIKINFVDQDGKEVIPTINQTTKIEKDKLRNNIMANFNNMKFLTPGTYSFDIVADNKHIGSVPLILQKI